TTTRSLPPTTCWPASNRSSAPASPSFASSLAEQRRRAAGQRRQAVGGGVAGRARQLIGEADAQRPCPRQGRDGLSRSLRQAVGARDALGGHVAALARRDVPGEEPRAGGAGQRLVDVERGAPGR